jgi:hypothetical protein
MDKEGKDSEVFFTDTAGGELFGLLGREGGEGGGGIGVEGAADGRRPAGEV